MDSEVFSKGMIEELNLNEKNFRKIKYNKYNLHVSQTLTKDIQTF